jgi:hypothetical protein
LAESFQTWLYWTSRPLVGPAATGRPGGFGVVVAQDVAAVRHGVEGAAMEHVSDRGEHGLITRPRDRVWVKEHGALGHGGDHAVVAGTAKEFLKLLDAVEDHSAGG